MDFRSLQPYSTCDVSDALRKLNQPNFFIGDLELLSTKKKGVEFMKTVGPAYTVNMVSADDKDAPRLPSDVHWMDRASRGDIVIINSPPGKANAVFGGLMGARASYLGVEGVIVNGRIRDVLELRSRGLTVLAKGQSSMGAGGFTLASTINEPILFPISSALNETNHVKIQPGDIVMADIDGVVVVPFNLVEEVVRTCEKLVEIDQRCMTEISNGSTVVAAFKSHR